MRKPLFALLAATALLTLLPTASAIYIVTPHHLRVTSSEVEVGDLVGIELVPTDDGDGAAYAGQKVVLNATSMEDNRTWTLGEVTLDAAATARFTWTIPAEADDLNLMVQAWAGGQRLGSVHLNVGDAEPMMFALANSEGGYLRNAEEGAPPQEDNNAQPASGDRKDASFLGLAAVAAALAAVLAVARRKQ